MKTVIYHNPRCSKSRQTLEIIRGHDIEPEIIEYLNSSLDIEGLEKILNLLGFDSALKMMRVKEPEFKEAELHKDSNNEDLISGIAKYPRLLERPIVVTDKGALICRPPALVKDIL